MSLENVTYSSPRRSKPAIQRTAGQYTVAMAERNRLRPILRTMLRNLQDLGERREWDSGKQSAKTLRNSDKRHEIRPLRAASLFRCFRPFTTVFGFCQHNVTRNVTCCAVSESRHVEGASRRSARDLVRRPKSVQPQSRARGSVHDHLWSLRIASGITASTVTCDSDRGSTAFARARRQPRIARLDCRMDSATAFG